MRVEQGSNLEATLNRQRIQMDTMKRGGFGGDTTLTDIVNGIKVTTKSNGTSTVQFGKKAKPIPVSVQSKVI